MEVSGHLLLHALLTFYLQNPCTFVFFFFFAVLPLRLAHFPAAGRGFVHLLPPIACDLYHRVTGLQFCWAFCTRLVPAELRIHACRCVLHLSCSGRGEEEWYIILYDDLFLGRLHSR